MNPKTPGGAPKGKEGKEKPKTELGSIVEDYNAAREKKDEMAMKQAFSRMLSIARSPYKDFDTVQVRFGWEDLGRAFSAIQFDSDRKQKLEDALLSNLTPMQVNGKSLVPIAREVKYGRTDDCFEISYYELAGLKQSDGTISRINESIKDGGNWWLSLSGAMDAQGNLKDPNKRGFGFLNQIDVVLAYHRKALQLLEKTN